MKYHSAIRWEANRRKKQNIILPLVNKILFTIDKLQPKLSDKVYIGSEDMMVQKPSAAERKIFTTTFDMLGIKFVEQNKKVSEYGIQYIRTYNLGGITIQDYDGKYTDEHLLFDLTFKYDLGAECKVTYKEELVKQDNCVIQDGEVFRIDKVVDAIDCGDNPPNLGSHDIGGQA